MIRYEYNDGGREAAGYKGKAGDCVVRAIAIISGKSYRDIYRACAEANSKAKRGNGVRSARNGVWKDAYEVVMKALGFEKIKLGRGGRPTFSEAHERYGNCVVKTTRHLAAIKDGALQDIFDGRTYQWSEYEEATPETRERKATSIWVLP